MLIGCPENIQALLDSCTIISQFMGFKWNASKSIVLSHPTLTSSLHLESEPIPVASSFDYLGIPITTPYKIDAKLLIAKNAKRANGVTASLSSIDIYSKNFTPVLTVKFYKTFLHPILEYGLAIACCSTTNLNYLDRCQDQCLRRLFGGHRTSSTKVINNMLNIPSLTERAHMLTFKFINRAIQLPSSTLLRDITRCFTRKSTRRPHQQQWCKILRSSPFFPFTRPPLPSGKLSSIVELYRQSELEKRFPTTDNNMYLHCYRPYLKLEPVTYLPMSSYDRNRILRWRRGWLSSKPVPCTDCNSGSHTIRSHLLTCFNVISKLDLLSLNNEMHSLDFVLNRLPYKTLKTESLKTETYFYWLHRWPLILKFLKDIDHLLHKDSEQVIEAMVSQPELLLAMLHPDKRTHNK